MKKQNSQNQDVLYRNLIKQFVKEEIQSMLEQDDNTTIVTQKSKKTQVIISDDHVSPIICECGNDITKFKPQQIEMHMRSKFHNENI